jgi:hypothetical protein
MVIAQIHYFLLPTTYFNSFQLFASPRLSVGASPARPLITDYSLLTSIIVPLIFSV